MAQVSWAAADRRDQDKIYNPTTLAALDKMRAGLSLGGLCCRPPGFPPTARMDRAR